MSILFAKPVLKTERLARLHLYSILPCFGELLKHVPQARKILGAHRFCLRLQAGQLSADLFFVNGRCRFSRYFSVSPHIILRYLSYAQLNKQFEANGFSLPLPLRGARHVGYLRAFSALGNCLQSALLEKSGLTAYGLDEAMARETHLRLTFSAALGAAVELINEEPFAKALFAGTGNWVAQFALAEGKMEAWIAREAGICYWGRGRAEEELTAILYFRNASVALRALGGDLDNLAAVNAGDIVIKGLTPLMDALGIVLARVPVYLLPR